IERLASHSQRQQLSLWSTLCRHHEVSSLDPDARIRLQRCVPLIQDARARRQRLPLRQVLEALWMALGGPACLDSAALLPNIATFFALLEQHAPHGDVVDIHA